MVARQAPLIVMGAIVLAFTCAMAALGTADADWAELPWALIVEPLFIAGVLLLVFAVSLASRRIGIFAALVCATPMFMLVGAPPSGIIGATLFFGAVVVAGMIAFFAAVAVSGMARRLRR